MITEMDLMGILPNHLRDDSRAYDHRGKMSEWEFDVCVWLFIHGYESKQFFTIDGDSFGPLVRGINLRKFGEKDWIPHTYG